MEQVCTREESRLMCMGETYVLILALFLSYMNLSLIISVVNIITFYFFIILKTTFLQQFTIQGKCIMTFKI